MTAVRRMEGKSRFLKDVLGCGEVVLERVHTCIRVLCTHNIINTLMYGAGWYKAVNVQMCRAVGKRVADSG